LWKTRSCCLLVSKEAWTTCAMCHLYYQSTTRGIKTWACQISIDIARLDLDASCNDNGLAYFQTQHHVFLVPIIVKCNKLVMMEAQTFLNFGASTCFMDKEVVRQYKLVLVEKNTLVPVEVINGKSLISNRLISYSNKKTWSYGIWFKKLHIPKIR
jgi:hypothetical protein